ncbi:hypothetical protein D1N76_20960, partial [Clostridioides difficile]
TTHYNYAHILVPPSLIILNIFNSITFLKIMIVKTVSNLDLLFIIMHFNKKIKVIGKIFIEKSILLNRL